jgi:hypothetical protein
MGQVLATRVVRQVGAPPSARPTPAGGVRIAEEWPQLWFATREREWSSLVVVPAAAGGTTAQLAARALAESARLYTEGDVHFVDGVGADHAAAAGIVAAMEDAARRGEPSIVAVDCPLASAAAIRIARAADAALLVVPLGAARLEGARRVLDAIGRERVIGSLVTSRGRRARGTPAP